MIYFFSLNQKLCTSYQTVLKTMTTLTALKMFHRMAEVRRNLLRSSCPKSLLRQSLLPAARCPASCSYAFWMPPRMEHPETLRATSERAQSPSVRKCFLIFSQNLLCFSVCPLLPVLLLHLQEPVSIFCVLSLWVLVHTGCSAGPKLNRLGLSFSQGFHN